MSLASIQSSVRNVMLFRKKRFYDFKNKFSESISGGHFFKMIIFQMVEFPNPPSTQTLSLIFSSSVGISKCTSSRTYANISWQIQFW